MESVVPKGLENPEGAYNCFINVVIQSLWHAQSFKDYFLEEVARHRHSIGDLKAAGGVSSPTKTGATPPGIPPLSFRLSDGKSPFELKQDTTGPFALAPKDQSPAGKPQDPSPVQGSTKRTSSINLEDPTSFCLVCSLYDLFVRYEFDESSKPLALGHFRTTLARLRDASVKGFTKGSMGSAQEAFEEILVYIHRASVFHQYSEMMATSQRISTIDTVELIIDQYPCNPPCAAHRVFNFQLCELVICPTCGEIMNMVNVVPRNEYMARVYVADFFAAFPKEKPEFALILRDALMAASMLPQLGVQYHSGCKEEKEGKKQALRQAICCYQLPSTFALSLEWGTVPPADVPGKVKQFMKCLSPLLDLKTVYYIADAKVEAEYVIRGFICYYGKHYVAYFYSVSQDQWLLYDDAFVKKVGHFGNVMDLCAKGHNQPILIIYESLTYIKQHLASKTGKSETETEKAFYENMKGNNFWKGGSSCDIF